MAEEKQKHPENGAGKGGWKLLAASSVAALVLGGGGFVAVSSGALPLQSLIATALGREGAPEAAPAEITGLRDGAYQPGAYVHLDPFVVSLGPESGGEHLKVALVLEVMPGREAEVEAIRPRLLDVLNVFLRAVEGRDIALPTSMERLRAQMLRRVQLVSPENAVRDVLIQEFVIN